MISRESADRKDITKLCDEFLTPESLVIEVGSFRGENSIVFSANSGNVLCIDSWIDYQEGNNKYEDMVEVEAHFDCQVASANNVSKFRATSDFAGKVLGNRVAELVYLDTLTAYEAVKNNIVVWWPKVKFGGVLSGYGYGSATVKKAVDEIFGKPDRIYSENSWAVMKFPGRWQEGDK